MSLSDQEFRKQNGLTQRIYLVKMELTKGPAQELVFHVLGTSSTVYKIKYSTKVPFPKCSCPDSTFRKQTCKHIHFLSNKVLFNYYNKKFTIDELKALYQDTLKRLPHLDHIYDKDIEQQYNQVLDESAGILHEIDKPRNADEDCCICMEPFTKNEVENHVKFIVSCKVCKNGIHKECWTRWNKHSHGKCPYCRAKNSAKKHNEGSHTDCVGNLRI